MAFALADDVMPHRHGPGDETQVLSNREDWMFFRGILEGLLLYLDEAAYLGVFVVIPLFGELR